MMPDPEGIRRYVGAAADWATAPLPDLGKKSTMTDEELDEARAREAISRVWPKGCISLGPELANEAAQTAARLARTGWTPTDPDLIEAREIVAKRHGCGAEYVAGVRAGNFDDGDFVPIVLAAIKRGRELAGGS